MTQVEWNKPAAAWAGGLVVGLVGLVVSGALVPALAWVHPAGGPGLLVPLLLFLLLPLEWIVVSTFLSWTSTAGLSASVAETPSDLQAFSSLSVRAGVSNGMRIMPAMFLRLRFSLEYEDRVVLSKPILMTALAPGGRSELVWNLTFRRRGLVRIFGLFAESALPGSLLKSRATFDLDRRVAVLPLLYRLSPEVSELLAGHRYAASSHVHLVPAGAEEFVGVRPYRPGDNPRFVNFPLSIRMPDFPYELVVREFEDPGEENVCIVLDSVLPPFSPDPAEFEYRLEKSISFAASLARYLIERKIRIRIVTLCGERGLVDVRGGARKNDRREIELALAALRPASDPDEFYRAAYRALSGSRAPVLFVSLRDHEALIPPGRAAVVIGPEIVRRLVENVETHDDSNRSIR